MRTRRTPLIAAIAALVALSLTGPTTAATTKTTLTLGGVECDLIKVPAGGPLIPVGNVACPGVRPGAIVQTPIGLCSFNFLFKGSDGYRYMGTAGHCILGEGPFPVDAGEKVWALGKGPIATDGAGKRVGRFAYAILQDPKDFALIRLDKTVAASASMCYFGGPTGHNTTTATGPVILHHYGNGLVIGDVLPARTSLTTSLASPDHVFANGAAMMGDSGSGVIDDSGKAVGVLVTIGGHVGGVTDFGFIGITRLKPQLVRAVGKLKLTYLKLQTATLAS